MGGDGVRGVDDGICASMSAVSYILSGMMVGAMRSEISADNLVFVGGQANLDICLSFGWSDHHVKGLGLIWEIENIPLVPYWRCRKELRIARHASVLLYRIIADMRILKCFMVVQEGNNGRNICRR